MDYSTMANEMAREFHENEGLNDLYFHENEELNV